MRFKLMHRNSPTHVQRCGRLALEFYCDAWAQVEARNLAFHELASQQAKYQSASVRAIFDQLNTDNARQIGVPVVLPASYPNSPRYYHNLYLDAVALPRRFGKPDLFVTITCNPKWREIVENIPPGSHWQDHMDIGMHFPTASLLSESCCSRSGVLHEDESNAGCHYQEKIIWPRFSILLPHWMAGITLIM